MAEQTETPTQTETPDLGGGQKRGDLMDAVKGVLEGREPERKEPIPTEPESDQPRADGDPEPDDGRLSDDGLGMQPAAGGDGGDSEADDDTLRALAEKAGVELDDLYKTEITLGDELGKKTIGELKDQAQTYARFEIERDTFEETRTAAESEMMQAQAELREVVAMLPEIKPELLQAARQKHSEAIASERSALYRIRPEWKNPERFAGVQEQIRDALSEYGFSAAESDSFFDHRATKLLHDFAVMRERFRTANKSHRQELDVARQNRARKGQPGDGKKAAQKSKQDAAKRQSSRPGSKLDAVIGVLDGALNSDN